MPQAEPNELLTVAESSDYQSTSRYAEVVDLLDRIQERSTILRRAEMGRTFENRAIPLVLLASPPVAGISQARSASEKTGKPIVFIMANIHAGEIEGKEAALMLTRELALEADHPLLKDLIIIIAPIYNADGNDRFGPGKENRPGQDGPELVGTRANAQQLDLNRDYIKLEAPETRALVKFLTECDPHLTIDCHTTNGSAHRYTLTYDAPLNPSGHPAPIDFVRDKLLPTVTKRLRDRTGYDTFFYGNFNRDRTAWETYSAEPRFGGSYQGLRGQMSVLSEAYSYAPYKDRVIVTLEFIREVLQYVAAHRAEVIEISSRARRETAAAGENPQPGDIVGIRHRIAAFNDLIVIRGYEHVGGGEGGAAIDPHVDHGPPKDYTVIHLGRFEPTLSVPRPHAYIIPPGFDHLVEKLRQHGIAVEPFTGDALFERYTVTRVQRSERAFQNHVMQKLDVTCARGKATFAPGSHIVRTAQPLGTLAVYLLEPQSEDGLATWNFLDDVLKEGAAYPIVRVRSRDDISVRPE
jgi:hypothetical protein